MKLSLNTFAICTDWPLEKIIEVARQGKYDALEFRVQAKQQHGIEIENDAAQLEAAKQKITAAGLETVCLSTSVQFASDDESVRAQHLETCKKIIDLAQRMGAKFLKVGANKPPEGVSDEDFIVYVAQSLRDAGAYAAPRGVQVLLEMHTPFWSIPHRAVKAMQLVGETGDGKSGTGLIFNCEPEDIADGSMENVFRQVQPFIPHIHIHDLLNRKIQYPYKELFSILKRDDFQGFLSVEISAHSLGENVDGEAAFKEIGTEFHRLKQA